jgi:hypothetical protein
VELREMAELRRRYVSPRTLRRSPLHLPRISPHLLCISRISPLGPGGLPNTCAAGSTRPGPSRAAGSNRPRRPLSTSPSRSSPTSPLYPSGPQADIGEMWGDVGRCWEIWGDTGEM